MVDHIGCVYPMERFFDFPQSAGRTDEATDFDAINSILNDFVEARPNTASETAENLGSAPKLQLNMNDGAMGVFPGAEVIGDSGNNYPLDYLDYQALPQVHHPSYNQHRSTQQTNS